MLHVDCADFLREEVIRRGCSAGHAEEDFISGCEIGEGFRFCGCFSEDGHGVGDLAFVGEGHGDVDDLVVVL